MSEIEKKSAVQVSYKVRVDAEFVKTAICYYLGSYCGYHEGVNVLEIANNYSHGDPTWVEIKIECVREKISGEFWMSQSLTMAQEVFREFSGKAVEAFLKHGKPSMVLEEFYTSIGEYNFRANLVD